MAALPFHAHANYGTWSIHIDNSSSIFCKSKLFQQSQKQFIFQGEEVKEIEFSSESMCTEYKAVLYGTSQGKK